MVALLTVTHLKKCLSKVLNTQLPALPLSTLSAWEKMRLMKRKEMMMGLYDMVTGSVGHWTGCWRLMKRKEMMM
jgi:hypothetical protein